jgi:hypothetical protein
MQNKFLDRNADSPLCHHLATFSPFMAFAPQLE